MPVLILTGRGADSIDVGDATNLSGAIVVDLLLAATGMFVPKLSGRR